MIMKSIKYVLMALVAALALTSCHGQEDEGMNNVPEGVLRIFADKTTIVADGSDVVTFTIMLGSRDVSEERTLQLVRNGKLGNYGEHTFSTAVAGSYTFSAEYYYDGVRYYTDNQVDVVATPLSASGEEKSYKQQILGFQFTSLGCPSCPALSHSIKQIQADFPDRLVAVSFHKDFQIADEMTHPMSESYYKPLKSDGLPQFNANFIIDKEYITVSEYDAIVNIMDRVEENYPATCGVAIESGVVVGGTPNSVKVSVKITSNTPSVYRYQIFLVEDNYVSGTQQYGAEGEYKHNNVVRVVSSNEVYGASFNEGMPMQVGVEAMAERTLEIPRGCSHENMRVVVAAFSSYNGGESYVVNNCAECPLNGSVDYKFEE